MSAAPSSPIGVGVIGLGFMGGTHVRAYQAAASASLDCPCRLVAVCDSSADRLAGRSMEFGNLSQSQSCRLIDAAHVRTTSDVGEILNADDIQLVSICTYTDTHVDLALRALQAGKHVLVEKPVAATTADAQRLARAAQANDRLCMPAMCMRFWPGWDWLHDRIVDHSFGEVRSATFERVGSQPSWAQEFYGDYSRSGGALLDLHIHDVDFIHWCFGPPLPGAAGVHTVGSLRHLTTSYRFADGPRHVTAEAGWDAQPNAGFRMRFAVQFEQATADFELSRSPSLMLHDARGSRPIELESHTGYDGEVRHLIDAIVNNKSLRVTMNDAVAVMATLDAERASLSNDIG